MNRPEKLNIAYIGRETIYKILLEDHLSMFDFHYTQFVDMRFNVQREIEKIFKLKNINTLVVDYYILNTDSEFTNALNNYKAINPEVHIIITLFEKKYHNNNFEIIKLGNLTLEIEKEYTVKEKTIFEKLSDKKDEFLDNIDDKKKKKKTLLKKNEEKIDIIEKKNNKIVPEKKENKDKESKPKKELKLNIPKLPSFPKIPKKSEIISSEIEEFNENHFKDDKVIALYSDYSLQGVSSLACSINKKYENSCVLDTNMSYCKMTDFASIENYLKETLVIPEYFEVNKSNIYSVTPSINSKDLKLVIRKLLTKYDKVIVDLKSEDLFKDLAGELTISSYFVIEEDFDIFHMTKYSSGIKIPYIKLIVNKTNTFNAHDVKEAICTDIEIIQIV